MPITSLISPEDSDNPENNPTDQANLSPGSLGKLDERLPNTPMLQERANTINREVDTIIGRLPVERVEGLRNEGSRPVDNIATVETQKVIEVASTKLGSALYEIESNAAENIEAALGERKDAIKLFSDIRSKTEKIASADSNISALGAGALAITSLAEDGSHPELQDPRVYGEAAKWVSASLRINRVFAEAVLARHKEERERAKREEEGNKASFYRSIMSKS